MGMRVGMVQRWEVMMHVLRRGKYEGGALLMMGAGVGRWSEYSEALLSLVSFHETRRERAKERHVRTLVCPSMNHPFSPTLPVEVLRGLRIRHPTHFTPQNHNRMRPSMSIVNTKRRRRSPRNTIIPPGPDHPRGPRTSCPVCGGGRRGTRGGRT